MNGKPWIPAEERALRTLYPHIRSVDVSRILGRPLPSIYQRAARLGIKKSVAFRSSTLSGRNVKGHAPHGTRTRFQKGHAPANKGLRRPGWAPGRMAETQFKKGHFPVNRDPDYYVIGALRVNADGYIDMRISFEPGAKGWRGLHLILWEDANGPIPKSHYLRFKDGDALNVELDNLMLVSRAENMRANSIRRYPKPLRSAIVALGQFKRRTREEQDRRLAKSSV